jgi:aryl-alcohol dehydrogenase-like predicted oxidoreductase
LSLAQLALAWVIHQAGITAAIVGARSAAHATEAASAGAIALHHFVVQEIEAACAGARAQGGMQDRAVGEAGA